jgi:hypothetical protein
MRENRPSGSEGGATVIPSSLPLSIIQSLRDKVLQSLRDKNRHFSGAGQNVRKRP